MVYVVDDDVSMRESLRSLLRSVGHDAQLFGTVPDFLAEADGPAGDCLILDVRLPGQSGLELQRELARAGIALPVVFITGHGDVPMSVAAMKAGAIEFLTKPFRDQDLLDAGELEAPEVKPAARHAEPLDSRLGPQVREIENRRLVRIRPVVDTGSRLAALVEQDGVRRA